MNPLFHIQSPLSIYSLYISIYLSLYLSLRVYVCKTFRLLYIYVIVSLFCPVSTPMTDINSITNRKKSLPVLQGKSKNGPNAVYLGMRQKINDRELCTVMN